MSSKKGTGHEFIRIPLEGLGALVIQDDGNDDWHLSILLEKSGGGKVGFLGELRAHRALLNNDESFERRLKKAFRQGVASGASTQTPPPQSGPFICDGCGLTWPSHRLTTPGEPTKLCPKCEAKR